jgi:hypothetical protein
MPEVDAYGAEKRCLAAGTTLSVGVAHWLKILANQEKQCFYPHEGI